MECILASKRNSTPFLFRFITFNLFFYIIFCFIFGTIFYFYKFSSFYLFVFMLNFELLENISYILYVGFQTELHLEEQNPFWYYFYFISVLYTQVWLP